MKDINIYTCIRCGAFMEQADDEVLICPVCGHSVEIEEWVSEPEYYEQESEYVSEYDTDDYWAPNKDFPGEGADDDEGEDEF